MKLGLSISIYTRVYVDGGFLIKIDLTGRQSVVCNQTFTHTNMSPSKICGQMLMMTVPRT